MISIASKRCCVSKAAPRGTRVVRNAESDHARSVPVGNGFWLLDPMQDKYFNVHGQDFIIQRIEAASHIFPKLRLRRLHQRQRGVQLVNTSALDNKMSPGQYAIVPSPSVFGPSPALFEGDPAIDITPMLELMQEGAQDLDSWVGNTNAPSAGMVPCSAAVHVPQPCGPQAMNQVLEGDGVDVFVSESTSPRRTKLIGFTCLCCNARSYRPVNPMAFEEGTLVVQCGKCEVWHKIKDHLGLFHEMKGEIFKRSIAISNEDIPPSLRLPLEPFYWLNQSKSTKEEEEELK
ncbi:hypothetical protein CEUSTIGMA_g1956.t1 [Chlamydomonas eustigma]|uniref:DNL-type domain-containing protein n=1 Tax=Chlamydomonas eustigma TaxID=1157962 RepID=A0A250WUK4_9CHLO|nr:hypothetical protein CEUSTIGMA_g1956.t1 [Chlamydomonas eustigma]|eukprot:GAX74507.1 hypothetical protein CEUSTIGMA_g1956.t1 [Chlamydomonas eustigma]